MAARGTDAVAQTYMGMPKTIITAIATRPVPRVCAKKSGGVTVPTSAAMASPMSRVRPMSRGKGTNP